MTITRIYQATDLKLQTKLSLDEKASHHLARVLRAKIGESIIIFNGQGGEYQGIIVDITKKFVIVEIKKFFAEENESPLQLCLAQGIARGDRMDMIIQKSVELGVSRIIPLMTERCNIKKSSLGKEKYQHWQSVAISACEQSGRKRLPIIDEAINLYEWLEEARADLQFVLSPHHAQSSQKLIAPLHVNLLVGPEGGLTNKEVEAALNKNFISLNLGPRILRTETASLAALSIMQFSYGDMKN